MSVKLKAQVALHRKDHDGSTIVRLHQIPDDSIPADQQVHLHQVIELHARTEAAVAALRAPGVEEYETMVKSGSQGQAVVDRVLKSPAAPGAIVYIEFTPVA